MRTLPILAALAWWPAAAAAPQAESPWSWRSGRQVEIVEIDLIRARVELVRREGPVEIVVRREGGEPGARAEIALEQRGGTVKIADVYPARTGYEECLPPDDGRGDYWTNVVRFHAVVRAPARVRLVVRVKERR